MYIASFGSNYCPVALVKKFLRIGKHKDGSALFRKVTHTKDGFPLCRQKLSYSRVLELVKYQLRQIGLDLTKYGLHWCARSPNHAPCGVVVEILRE